MMYIYIIYYIIHPKSTKPVGDRSIWVSSTSTVTSIGPLGVAGKSSTTGADITWSVELAVDVVVLAPLSVDMCLLASGVTVDFVEEAPRGLVFRDRFCGTGVVRAATERRRAPAFKASSMA